MRSNRVYVDIELLCHQQLQLPAAQSHHLSKVLRMQVGQTVHVFNGAGGYYRAEIAAVQKRVVVIMLREFIPDEPITGFRINLAQAISRGRHMDYTIQKAVELGVARIMPLVTDHSNINLSEDRLENKLGHWRNIIIAACEQCGRNVLPEIMTPVAYTDWIAAVSTVPRFMLDPSATAGLAAITPRPAEVTIIAGPEGGFSERELDLAATHKTIAVRLGPRILRTETAAIAAISAVQTLWGDMG